MKLTFVIPCYYTPEHTYIYDCVSSIERTNPTADIVVVDSSSPDKTYFSKINATVLDVNNKHYAFGGYWEGFKARPNSDYYAFIHDSTIVRHPLTPELFGTKQITPFYWFPDNDSSQWAHIKSWAINQAKVHANYSYSLNEVCLYGGLFTATNKFMSKLMTDGFDKIKPSIKMEAVYADELLWSIAATANGESIVRNSHYGRADNILGDDKCIWKFSGSMQKGMR